MMQEVEVLKTIPELVCSYFSEEQFTLSATIRRYAKKLKRSIMEMYIQKRSDVISIYRKKI